MVNAWSLAYDVINGTLDENFPPMTDNTITSRESDEYDPKPKSDKEETDWKDPVITVGSGNTASANFVNFDLTDEINNVTIDTSNFDFAIDTTNLGTVYPAPGVGYTGNIEIDSCVAYGSTADFVYAGDAIGDSVYADTWPHAETLNINVPDPDYFASMDGVTLPTPGIKDPSTRKYKEDESIEALKNYISTTYGGHYTSDNNDVQTLDLIESVGDAESFCRSNAIKYLSRYDKKGQAKRDILKALHYTLLLYHFSGQLNETPTRGYETF